MGATETPIPMLLSTPCSMMSLLFMSPVRPRIHRLATASADVPQRVWFVWAEFVRRPFQEQSKSVARCPTSRAYFGEKDNRNRCQKMLPDKTPSVCAQSACEHEMVPGYATKTQPTLSSSAQARRARTSLFPAKSTPDAVKMMVASALSP